MVIPELKKINSRAVDHIADIAMDSLNLGEDITGLIEEMENKHIESFNTEAANIEPTNTESTNTEAEKRNKAEIDIEILRNNIRIVQGEMVLSRLSDVCGRRKGI